MINYALIVFAIAAVGGLLLAYNVLGGKLAPWPLSITHALLGALGLVLLASAVYSGHGTSRVTVALAILVITAVGGFYLASKHLVKQIPPKAIVFIHAGAAIAGFLTLVTVVFGK
ncbi:MAG: hypothetical protein V4493_12105 [Pseudomonadota bacterium]